MDICFVIKLNSDCYKNNTGAEILLMNRIINTLEYGDHKAPNDENAGVAFIENSDIIIELGKYNENERIYIINILGIEESEKNKLLVKLRNDETFENINLLYDEKSNEIIRKEYTKLSKFEINIRMCFVFALVDNYKEEIFEIIENKFNTKEVLRNDNDNVFNKIYTIPLDELVDFIKENNLGGKEYELYIEAAQSGNLNELLNRNIFVDAQRLLKNEQVSTYRNAICHNRIINSEEFTNKCIEKFDVISNNFKDLIEKKINDIFNIDTFSLDTDDECLLFLIRVHFEDFEKEFKIISNKIINYFGFMYNAECVEYDLTNYCIKYNSYDQQGIEFNFKLIGNDETGQGIIYIYAKYKNNNDSIFSSKEFITLVINNISKEYQLSVLWNNFSVNYNNELFREFNYIENTLRAYLTSIYFGLETKLPQNKRSELSKDISLEVNKISSNVFYQLDFYDLLQVLIKPKGGDKINTLNEKLRILLNNDQIDKINSLLANIVESNEDIKIISDNADELYKYRTMMAHSYFITSKEHLKIKALLDNCKVIIENIFLEYISEKFIFSSKEVKISDNSIDDKINIIEQDNTFNLLVYYTNSIESEIYSFKNLSKFDLYKVINILFSIDIKSNFIFTDLVIDRAIKTIYQNSYREITKKDIEEVCNKIPWTRHTKYLQITSEEAKLEKEIGILLKKLEGVYK